MPLIYLTIADCTGALDDLRRLVESRNCVTAAPGFGSGFTFLCDGERNALVRTVAQTLRVAFENAEGP